MSIDTPRKSLVEQIIDATFDKLDTLETFNPLNILQLRELAQNDDLRRYSQIIVALKADSGDVDETS